MRVPEMESIKISSAFLVLVQWTSQAFSDMNIIQERFVKTTNIITRIPFTTLTSCFMKCSAHNKCSSIGFGVDPAFERNSECLLLEKIDDCGMKENKDLVSLFVVMIENAEEIVTKKSIPTVSPVDGGYSDWSEYTTCSRTCGRGIQIRSRDCNNPFPRGSGANCSKLGNSTEERSCNLKTCPTTFKCNFITGDGVGSAETKIGNQKREECFKACLDEKKSNDNINGVSIYTDMNRGGCWCEIGMTSRNVNDMKYTSCFLEPTMIANGVKCNFITGDGWGAAETKIGNQKGEECFKACLEEKKSNDNINGVSIYTDMNKGGCWCEIGMTSRNVNDMKYTSCFLEAA